MEQKNDMLGVEDIVFMLLETLKSNGTFDEIRRHCVTDIDAKPTYQNWKQRIESNVHKFLSKVNYTPELNKNTIWERLRKHLLDGRETQDIEEETDRILTQVLAPRTLSMFEPKIAITVDEYLGIKNEAPPIELNGLKESSKNLINVSNIENSTVFNSKIGADNIACDKAQKDDTEDLRSEIKEKSSSLCKEPKSLNGNQSDGENDIGECLKQKISQHKTKIPTSDKSKSSSSNHKSNKKDNICKEVVDKSKDINNKANDIVNKPKDIGTKSNEFIDNPKEVINKSKDVIDKPKGIFEKSKDVSKPKDIVEKSKDIINKTKDMVDKSKNKLFLSKNSNSNSSSHKSNRTDTKRTKRSVEEKKKSSSLCKEPKLLNGNRSDDESNAGGSSKQKSTIYKNKSSSTDKTKSSSSNHKSSRKDNTSTDVVDKSKDKSLSKNSTSTDVDKSKHKSSSSKNSNKSKDKSLSKNSHSTEVKSKDKSLSKNSNSADVEKSKNKKCSSHKSNRNDSKRLKLSQPENKLPINNERIEESKSEKQEEPEWNDFRSSSITNDELDAANVLLSMSTISYESSHSEIITKNILFIEYSPPITETLKTTKIESVLEMKENELEVKENELNIKENIDQTKTQPSSYNNDIKENSELKPINLEKLQLSKNYLKAVSSCMFEKECTVNLERYTCKNINIQSCPSNNVEITKEHQKSDEKEFKTLNVKVNLDPNENDKTNECNSNAILKVPKLKIKLLPNQIDSINKCKRKKHHKESKKLKLSKKLDIPSEDSVSTSVMCEKLDQKFNNNTEVKMNDSASTLSKQTSSKEIENNSLEVLDDEKSHCSFKGFSKAQTVPFKNYKKVINVIKASKAKTHKNDVKPINSEKLQLSKNYLKALSTISSHMFEKECTVNLERYTCKNINIQSCPSNNVEITKEHQKSDEKEFKTLNVKVNLDPNENDKTNECNSNAILKVPKLKIKLLPNQIDSINKCKRKKHHKESKKLKLSKKLDIPSEDSVSTSVMCEKLDQKFNNNTEVKMNDSASTLSKQTSSKEIENNSLEVLDDEKSHCSFKGFSKAQTVPFKNYKKVINVIEGFTNVGTHPCKHRDAVYAELIKFKDGTSSTDSDFIGFSAEKTQMSNGHKYAIQQLELTKKQFGSNRIQNGKVFNEEVTAYLYENYNDSDAISRAIYKSINDDKKDCTTENNNNHKHDNWVVEQEMKYKLLPFKVALERLERMEYGCSSSKHVSDSSHVPI